MYLQRAHAAVRLAVSELCGDPGISRVTVLVPRGEATEQFYATATTFAGEMVPETVLRQRLVFQPADPRLAGHRTYA